LCEDDVVAADVALEPMRKGGRMRAAHVVKETVVSAVAAVGDVDERAHPSNAARAACRRFEILIEPDRIPSRRVAQLDCVDDEPELPRIALRGVGAFRVERDHRASLAEIRFPLEAPGQRARSD
jgi:hypothetical protein